MDRQPLPPAVNDCYRRNLSALDASQPEIAAIISSVQLPPGVQPATGRDGTATLLIPGKDGALHWFGQSSMPRVSAEEMLCNLQRNGGSVLLPSILTGFEPLVASDRLAPHLAVFVIERDPAQVKLAVHLHDYTELLANGRLVFLVGEDLEAGLLRFFQTHPGCEMPVHLFNVPQRTPAETTDLQRRLEATGEGVLVVQAKAVDSHARAIRRRFEEDSVPRVLPLEPRVAVLSSDFAPESLEHAARIGRALDKLGWGFVSCVPDRPDRCHVAARMRAIEQARADIVIFVNGHAGTARPLLPQQLPIASWYLSGVRVSRIAEEQVGPFDLFMAASPGVQADLAAAGVPTGAIERCDVAADDTAHYPMDVCDGRAAEIDVDVAVFMDLPDDRPEAVNVTLPSHVALWKAAQEVVRGEVDKYRDDRARELFDRAQRKSGTTVREAPIRDRFVELLRTRIVPAASARAAVRALVKSGRRIAVWGANWSTAGAEGTVPCGPIPLGRELNLIFNAADWIVLPVASESALQLAVDALAAGASVACRAGNVPFAEAHPGLASLAPYLHCFRSSRELVNLMRLRRSPDVDGEPRAAAARDAVLRDHTFTHRIMHIAGRLRERQGASEATGGNP